MIAGTQRAHVFLASKQCSRSESDTTAFVGGPFLVRGRSIIAQGLTGELRYALRPRPLIPLDG